MKKIIMLFFLVLITISVFSQSRIVFNNDAYLVIDYSALLVIDNANPNAITIGTGGNIKSENELDRIKWNIAATTGIYTIPWTTNSNVKIPLEINKTTAGVGGGNFILSTWETATDMNTPWPSLVTNMNSSTPPPVDGSLDVVDRFWHIDARTYTTKPSITIEFGYDDAANEMIGTNTINEANLQAQRFNTSTSNWEATKLFGTVNIATNKVSGATISPADFFEDWILVDNSAPLPVTLTSFEATCRDKKSTITWITATEVNNDYFILEKSYDAITFFELVEIQGAGNSNVINNYSVIDPNSFSGSTYYRLKQVDFDGATTYHKIITTNCNVNDFEVNQVIFNSNSLNFNIITDTDEELIIYLYDYSGRLVSYDNKKIKKGNNSIQFDNLQISSGIYMLSIIGEYNVHSIKLRNIK